MPDDPKKPETKTAVADPVPAKPAAPGEPDPAALKPKETIPGGLTINPDGNYVNANNEYVDTQGKKVDHPVKAQKGETPVQDYLDAQKPDSEKV